MSGVIQMLLAGVKKAVVDPFFNYVTLLLPGNGTNGAQNNTFVDSSTNAFTITRNGNTTQGTFSPFSQTGWSNYFDGSGDELTLSTTTAAQIGANDFSFECFVYPTRQTNTYAQGLISYGIVGSISGTSYASLQMSPTGYAAFYYAQTSVETLADTTLLPLHQWSHVAACRSGSTLSLFVNGSRVATTTTSATVGSSGDRITIGGQFYENASTRQLQGYISNARIVKGSSAYDASQTTITVPTAPLTAISNTSLLTCQSNRFIDTSTNAYAITAAGNTSIQAFSPFNPTAAWSAATNGGSGYFDGSGDYLSGIGAVSDFNFMHDSSALWTFECWLYTTSTSNQYLLDNSNGTTSQIGVYIGIESSNLLFTITRGSSGTWVATGTSTSTVPINQWVHLAITYDQSLGSDNGKFYINGVASGTATKTANAPSASNASNAMRVGAFSSGSSPVIGYLSNVRITNSIVYSSAFTPPTSPLTAISNTELLCNFTNAGIYDATAKNDLETVGNAQISTTQSQWGGSSIYLDGNGDRLIEAASPNLALGTGDFTIECWLRRSSASSLQATILQMSSGADSYSLLFGYTSGSDLVIYASSNGSSWDIASAQTLGTVQNDTWVHYALTRAGSTFRAFEDGVQQSTWTSSSSIYQATNQCSIGYAQATHQLAGYIQDLRITKGVARYTTGFTPPTAAFLLN